MHAHRYHYKVLFLFVVCLLGLGEVKCMDCLIIVKRSLVVINFSVNEDVLDLRVYGVVKDNP